MFVLLHELLDGCQLRMQVPGMVNIKQKACVEPDCRNRPSCNWAGAGVGVWCSKHKAEGMVDVRNKTCENAGCPKASPAALCFFQEHGVGKAFAMAAPF